MKVTNIQWDINGYDNIELPSEIEIPDNLKNNDEISDYLSNLTGFCHKGYCLESE